MSVRRGQLLGTRGSNTRSEPPTRVGRVCTRVSLPPSPHRWAVAPQVYPGGGGRMRVRCPSPVGHSSLPPFRVNGCPSPLEASASAACDSREHRRCARGSSARVHLTCAPVSGVDAWPWARLLSPRPPPSGARAGEASSPPVPRRGRPSLGATKQGTLLHMLTRTFPWDALLGHGAAAVGM